MDYYKKYFKNLHKRNYGSSCCGYPVRIEGKITCYHICDKCDKPCDLIKIRKSLAKRIYDICTRRIINVDISKIIRSIK